MAIFDANGAKAGTLVAAALESAGEQIQAQMLQFVNGDSGQMLAGAFFVFGIATAVLIMAIGGNYKWGRYLLVAPPLFFFLTQVRTTSNGTDWQFADQQFARSHVDRALRGVQDFNGGARGGSDVALFFQVWNVFMSDLTQNLISLLNLTQDKSHLDFITKTERYMQLWVFTYISDRNLQHFIHLTMVSQCADYYMMKKAVNDPNVNDVLRATYRTAIREREGVRVFNLYAPATEEENRVNWHLINRAGFPPGNYTCDQIWQLAIQALRSTTLDDIVRNFTGALGVNQLPADVERRMRDIFSHHTSRATGQVLPGSAQHAISAASIIGNAALGPRGVLGSAVGGAAGTGDPVRDAELLQIVDEVLAHSLWQVMRERNRYTEYFNLEGHSAIFATMPSNGMNGSRVSRDPTHHMIAQFNRTEMWQFKGDFVNAALALPHFQGVCLMMLAACYPFFAMAMVIPGRSGSMLAWMGLWTWVKLWDFGFAVVMMIDNILFTLFPRGPGLAPGDINDPGRAWARILEIDPNYSATVYYNMIATCLFAVPVATAVFVKGAGAELVGVVSSSFQKSSKRLGGSAVTYARSQLSQSYVGRQRRRESEITAQALHDVMFNSNVREGFLNFVGLQAGAGVRDNILRILDNPAARRAAAQDAAQGVTTAMNAYTTALGEQQRTQLQSYIAAYAALRRFEHSISAEASFASESAVAARYYSHDTAVDFPGNELMSLQTSSLYFNAENSTSGIMQGMTNSFGSIFNFFIPGAGGTTNR